MPHPFIELEEDGIKYARLIETAAGTEGAVCDGRDTEIENGFTGHYQTYKFGNNALVTTFLSEFDDEYRHRVDVGVVAMFGQHAAAITVHRVATRSIPPSPEDGEYWEAMIEVSDPDHAPAVVEAWAIAKKIDVPEESDIDIGSDQAMIMIRKLVTLLRASAANAAPTPSDATAE